jgi:hypothetical protein
MTEEVAVGVSEGEGVAEGGGVEVSVSVLEGDVVSEGDGTPVAASVGVPLGVSLGVSVGVSGACLLGRLGRPVLQLLQGIGRERLRRRC